MYINYLNREHFTDHEDCKVNFDFKQLNIEDCANYSDQDYTEMRKAYLTALETTINKKSTCMIQLTTELQKNIDTSKAEQKSYQAKIDNEYKLYTEKELEKIKNNKQKMNDLQTNIIASEQRLSDSKKNNYRNKIKLIIFIVAITVFVLIELILIIV